MRVGCLLDCKFAADVLLVDHGAVNLNVRIDEIIQRATGGWGWELDVAADAHGDAVGGESAKVIFG